MDTDDVIASTTGKSGPPRWMQWTVLALLACFSVLLIVNEKRDVKNALAVLAAIAAIVLIVRDPGLCRISRCEWVFAGLLGAFLAVNVLSMLIAPEIPGRGEFSYKRLQVTGVMVALAAGLGLRDSPSVRRLLFALLAVAGLWYLAEAVSLPWRDAWLDGRLQGFRRHHSLLGCELTVLLCFYLSAIPMARGRWTAALTVCGALLIGVLLALNNTRAALLTVGCVSVPLLVLLQRRWGSWRWRVIAACVWIFVCLPVAGRTWGRWTDPRRKTDVSVAGRMSAYRTVLKLGCREPWGRVLIGNGRSGRVFEAAAAYYGFPRVETERRYLLHAHNTLLQTFIETGLAGALVLAGIWFVALRSAVAAWRAPPGAVADMSVVMITALVSVAVIGTVDYVLWKVPGELIWLLAGMAFACGRGARPGDRASPKAPDDAVSAAGPMLEETAGGNRI